MELFKLHDRDASGHITFDEYLEIKQMQTGRNFFFLTNTRNTHPPIRASHKEYKRRVIVNYSTLYDSGGKRNKVLREHTLSLPPSLPPPLSAARHPANRKHMLPRLVDIRTGCCSWGMSGTARGLYVLDRGVPHG